MVVCCIALEFLCNPLLVGLSLLSYQGMFSSVFQLYRFYYLASFIKFNTILTFLLLIGEVHTQMPMSSRLSIIDITTLKIWREMLFVIEGKYYVIYLDQVNWCLKVLVTILLMIMQFSHVLLFTGDLNFGGHQCHKHFNVRQGLTVTYHYHLTKLQLPRQ